MAARKDRRSKIEQDPKQRESKLVGKCAFPGDQERLPVPIPMAYQVAIGTSEEIVAWLVRVPRNTRAILISFPNEASYIKHGPIFWHVAHKLPEIVARVQRRRFEQLVDALTQSLPAQPEPAPAAGSGAGATPVTRALPRRRRGNAE